MLPLPPNPDAPLPDRAAAPASPPLAALPPFTPAVLERQVQWDTVLRRAAITLIVVLLIASSLLDSQSRLLGSVAILAAIGVWMAMSMTSALVLREVPRITALVEHDAPFAEAALAEALRRRPLQPTVRLSLYHRLAMLRHRQRRFAETQAICSTILSQDPRGYHPFEPSLLLIYADAALECGNLHGAYTALARLHALNLGMIESLQRLAMQTRYEIVSGHDAHALAGIDRKIKLIELMPQPTCGILHAMLAAAAKRTGRAELAHWFHQRAQLLCTPAELQNFTTSQVSVTA